MKLLFETKDDLIYAIDCAKRQAKKRFGERSREDLLSFPNPCLLAVDATTGERISNEPVFFRGYPSFRTIRQMTEAFPGAEIVAVYDMSIGTFEARINGDMDEPTGDSADVKVFGNAPEPAAVEPTPEPEPAAPVVQRTAILEAAMDRLPNTSEDGVRRAIEDLPPWARKLIVDLLQDKKNLALACDEWAKQLRSVEKKNGELNNWIQRITAENNDWRNELRRLGREV